MLCTRCEEAFGFWALRGGRGEEVSKRTRQALGAVVKNGRPIEVERRMGGRSNAKTTGPYDRNNDGVRLDEMERTGI